eukprot:6945063-Pyramimonas_sp.AAC.1
MHIAVYQTPLSACSRMLNPGLPQEWTSLAENFNGEFEYQIYWHNALFHCSWTAFVQRRPSQACTPMLPNLTPAGVNSM